MKKQRSYVIALAGVLAAFILLVLYPANAAQGARQGLAVCGRVIIPALLPFLILSRLLTALGLPGLLAKAAGPFLKKLGLSPYAAVPLALGLTGGYPVGAASLGALVREGALAPEEAARLLPWCNNTGPAFIVGAAGAAVFGSGGLGLGLYLCHVLAALTLGLCSARQGAAAAAPSPPAERGSFARALPEAVRESAAAMVSICAFVVFFSVLAALLDALGALSGAAFALARLTGAAPQGCRALLVGILELGSGIAALEGLSPAPGTLALAAFLLGFGGLSVHCQTLSVLGGTDVKCARHFVGRMLHGALSALYAFLLFTLLRI